MKFPLRRAAVCVGAIACVHSAQAATTYNEEALADKLFAVLTSPAKPGIAELAAAFEIDSSRADLWSETNIRSKKVALSTSVDAVFRFYGRDDQGAAETVVSISIQGKGCVSEKQFKRRYAGYDYQRPATLQNALLRSIPKEYGASTPRKWIVSPQVNKGCVTDIYASIE
jgi:hypothetical protein